MESTSCRPKRVSYGALSARALAYQLFGSQRSLLPVKRRLLVSVALLSFRSKAIPQD